MIGAVRASRCGENGTIVTSEPIAAAISPDTAPICCTARLLAAATGAGGSSNSPTANAHQSLGSTDTATMFRPPSAS